MFSVGSATRVTLLWIVCAVDAALGWLRGCEAEEGGDYLYRPFLVDGDDAFLGVCGKVTCAGDCLSIYLSQPRCRRVRQRSTD